MVAPVLGINAGITVVASLVLIGALIVNILILTEVNKGPPKPDGPPVTTTPVPGTKGCAASGKVSDNAGFADAATQLLRGLDRTIDPCDDFYSFTCNTFLNNKDEQCNAPFQRGEDRQSCTRHQAQTTINLGIADYLDNVKDDSAFNTEKIAKAAFRSCVSSNSDELSIGDVVSVRTNEVNQDLHDYIGFPFFGTSKAFTMDTFWEAAGRVERQFMTSILITSMVKRDLAVENAAAFYLDQDVLPLVRDQYVLPSFIADLQAYESDLEDMINDYRLTLGLKVANCPGGKTDAQCVKDKASWVVEFERKMAMASWPQFQDHNAYQQYNPLTFDDLPGQYPGINLQGYINNLMANIEGVLPLTQNVVVEQTTYLAWVSSLLESGTVTVDELTDYLAISFLLDSRDYHMLGTRNGVTNTRAQLNSKQIKGLDSVQPKAVRKGRGVRKLSYRPQLPSLARGEIDSVKDYCVETLLVYMPYAPGYIYVRNRDDRDEVVKDVTTQTNYVIEAFRNMIDSLDWMLDDDKVASKEKLSPDNQVLNIGWPVWLYGNFDAAAEAILDDYHSDYAAILDAKTYWETTKARNNGYQTREWYRLLLQTTNEELRRNFLNSPAMVNAWFQPELNSITFPLASFIPPYYDLSFPQAYRYAGQGGNAGHEVAHGFTDDEGIQYGPNGLLIECNFATCGFLSPSSREGLTNMMQCVVQQYNMQCCPLKSGNVRCVNGDTSKLENTVDIGGQQAAYNAYQMWIKNENGGNKEDLLPGMEDYAANQIFWIAYGFSHCSKISDESLVKQLLTDPHSPSVCRVNQVMRDIPQFGRDFKCKRGSTEYPFEAERCKVWTGLG